MKKEIILDSWTYLKLWRIAHNTTTPSLRKIFCEEVNHIGENPNKNFTISMTKNEARQLARAVGIELRMLHLKFPEYDEAPEKVSEEVREIFLEFGEGVHYRTRNILSRNFDFDSMDLEELF